MVKETNSIGTSWNEYKENLLTPEERNEIELKTAIISEIIKARQSRGISQK